MRYKILCLQRGGHYFADGELFESLEAVRKQLVSYHSIDCDKDSLETQSLADIASGFEWEIQDENGDIVSIEELELIK